MNYCKKIVKLKCMLIVIVVISVGRKRETLYSIPAWCEAFSWRSRSFVKTISSSKLSTSEPAVPTLAQPFDGEEGTADQQSEDAARLRYTDSIILRYLLSFK